MFNFFNNYYKFCSIYDSRKFLVKSGNKLTCSKLNSLHITSIKDVC